MPNLPLEDDPCDIIGKAMRGLGINTQELALKSGLAEQQITQLLNGATPANDLEQIAPSLGFSAKALIGLATYTPNINPSSGLEMITSPFGHAGVNSYIISANKNAVVFDTGTDSSLIFKTLKEKKLNVAAVVITHEHHDHTSGIQDFHNTPILLPGDLNHGEQYEFGGVSFTALDVNGHALPARAYFHKDLEMPVCILGDAIFAGSMGGTQAPERYQLALKTIRDNILTLPSQTILATGHGPLTSVALEMEHNPFLA